jgi:small-conductance mechanosensitive channel
LCDEQLQVINGILRVWATILGVVEENIETFQAQSDAVIRDGEDLHKKSLYSIEDWTFVEMQIEEVDEQIKKELVSRNAALPERTSLVDQLEFLKKEAALKKKEFELATKRVELGSAEEHEVYGKRFLQQKEQDLITDKVAQTEIKIRKIDFELSAVDDEIGGLKARLARLMVLVAKIKRNLMIEAADVARLKIKKEEQEALLSVERDRIRAILNEKTFEKERIRERYEGIKTNLSNLRSASKENSPEGLLLQAKESLDKNIIKSFDIQISLLSADDDFAHALALEKAFNYTAVHIRYLLLTGSEVSRSWIDEINTTRRILDHDIKKYEARKNDALVSHTHMQEEQDRLKRRLIEIAKADVGDKSREIIASINDAREAVRHQSTNTLKIVSRSNELLKIYHRVLRQCVSSIGDLEARRVNVNIWRRSSRGISLMMIGRATEEIQHFSKMVFWKLYDFFDVVSLFRLLSWSLIFGLILGFMVFGAGFILVRHVLYFLRRRLQLFVSYQNGTFIFWYLNVLLLFFDAILRQIKTVYTLLFLFFHFKLRLSYWSFLPVFSSPTAFSGFFLCSVAAWVYLANDFLSELRLLNARLSYFFYGERNQQRTTMLLDILFYSTAIIIPFRSALMLFGSRYEFLPNVLFAGYSLLVIIALALFFEKDDFTTLIFGRSDFWLKVRTVFDRYFYPLFVFFVVLCLLANPYVGYSQLAWYLAFFAPISVGVIFCALFIYGILREKVVWIFIEQRDDEMVSRFENAKVYYGFFVTVTFFALCFFMVGVLSHIWGLQYNFARLWAAVCDDWVFAYDHTKIGIIEILTVYLFVVCGYLVTTLLDRFILNKIYEVFGAEPGAQNTFSRIFHIVFLLLAFMLGLSYIGLAMIVIPVLVSIALAASLASKDFVADFVAGLLILLERQIEIGHYVSTENTRGLVHKISARSTIIRTAQNYFVVIPNRNLISHSLFNWGAGKFSVGFELTVTVGYENDPDLIISLLRKVMNAHALVLRVPAAVIRLENFAPSGADYFVRGFVSIRKVREQWEVASDLRVAVYKLFREKGVVFPYPKMVLYQNQNKPDDAQSFFKFNFDPTVDAHVED